MSTHEGDSQHDDFERDDVQHDDAHRDVQRDDVQHDDAHRDVQRDDVQWEDGAGAGAPGDLAPAEPTQVLSASPVTEPVHAGASPQPLAPVWSYEPQPSSAYQGAAGYGYGYGQPYAAAAPTTASPATGRKKGPGWGALMVATLMAALLAGGLGGLAGGWLAANDYLDFGPNGYTAPSPVPAEAAADRPEGSIANISANALPSVVTILVSGPGGQTAGSGSGWAFDALGHVVTNNHVIETAADSGSVVVQTADGQRHEASVVGRDESYDLAVLKVDGVRLNPLPLGDSSDVRVGDEVIAMGAPLGLDSTVTAGIVSALNRPVSPGGGGSQTFINAIQTDAAINPGNSGGPLLNMSGQVIGVNSAIATMPSLGGASGSIGVGFAIPSNQVSKTVEQLIRTGKAEHPIIGVILDRQYQGEGVRILGEGEADQEPIVQGGPADLAGLQPGDIILEFEDRPMTTPDELVVAIRAMSVGDEVDLRVRRGSATLNVTMTLQGRTPDS